MATDHILALLIRERDKLTEAIEALQRKVTTGKASSIATKKARVVKKKAKAKTK
jgi:hypothetical protein